MYEIQPVEINYMMLLSVPVALGFIVMLRDTVTRIMTFVKGFNID